MTSGSNRGNSNRGGVIGGKAPPEKRVDAFPLMSFVKNNCHFEDDAEESIDPLSQPSEDAIRAAKDRRFQELLDQASASSKRQLPLVQTDSEDRQKALNKIHEMEWKRNQKDTWKVQEPKQTNDYGGFLRPLKKDDIGEYFGGTRKAKNPKEHKRNRTVSEVLLLEDGKILPAKGEEPCKAHTKQVVTNLPMRLKAPFIPSKGLPFTAGPPISPSNSVWTQRSGSELFSDVGSHTLTAYGVNGDEDEAFALAIAESIRTAKQEQNIRINMQELYDAQFHQTPQQPIKPVKVERPPPDPVGTVWDSDSDEDLKKKPQKQDFQVQPSKNDYLFHPDKPNFVGEQQKEKACNKNRNDDFPFEDKKAALKKTSRSGASISILPLPQREQKHSVNDATDSTQSHNFEQEYLNASHRRGCKSPNHASLKSLHKSSISEAVNFNKPRSENVLEPGLTFRPISKPSAHEPSLLSVKGSILKPTNVVSKHISTQKKTSDAHHVAFNLEDDDSACTKNASTNDSTSFKAHSSNELSISNQLHKVSISSHAPDLSTEKFKVLPNVPQRLESSEEVKLEGNKRSAYQSQAEPKVSSYGDSYVRPPNSMPSVIMALASNKGTPAIPGPRLNEKTCTEKQFSENPMETAAFETNIKSNVKDPLSFPLCNEEHSSREGQYDMNMNVGNMKQPSDVKETPVNPLDTTPMTLPGFPWQFSPFSTGMPPWFPSILPQLNNETLNGTSPLISPDLASQQAQMALQMMLMQQAMCMPSALQQAGQTFPVPQTSAAVVPPSAAMFQGQNIGSTGHSPAAIPNTVDFGFYGLQGNPTIQPNFPIQPGLSNLAPTGPSSSVGKGRGRLFRH